MKIIRTNGEVEHHAQPLTFEKAREVVGGYIEVVTLKRPQAHSILVNEDGRPLNLPLNAAATKFCGRLLLGDVVLIETQQESQIFWGEE
jgi:hypothetical protein